MILPYSIKAWYKRIRAAIEILILIIRYGRVKTKQMVEEEIKQRLEDPNK